MSFNPGIVTTGLVLYADAANPSCCSPNVFPKPTDIYAWVNNASGSGSTLSRDTTVQSPVGNSPLKMAQTGNDAHTPTYNNSTWNLAPAAQGQTWTASVWVKASATTTIEGMLLFEANSAGNYTTLSAGPTVTIGPAWQRIQLTRTLTQADTAYVQLRLEGTQTSGAGITVWWDGLQVERQSSATAFNGKTNVNNANFTDMSKNSYAMTDFGGTIPVKTAGLASYFNTSAVTTAGLSVNGQNFTGLYDLTMECVVKVTGTHPAYTGSFMSSGDWNNTHWAFGIAQGNNQIQLRRPYQGWNYTVNTNTWYHITWRRIGSVNTMFVNGSSLGDVTDTADTVLISNATNTGIGRETYAGGVFRLNGYVAIAKIYNRGLSNAEVTQNFNAIRGRFGL